MITGSFSVMAAITEETLNNGAERLLPELKELLGTQKATTPIDGVNTRFQWELASPPQFTINRNRQFQIELPLAVSTEVKEIKKNITGSILACCQVSTTGEGKPVFTIMKVFTSSEAPVLGIIVKDWQMDLEYAIKKIMNLIQLPIGPIKGLTYSGHQIGTVHNALIAIASTGGAPLCLPETNPLSSDFGAFISRNTFAQFINENWWSHQEKSVGIQPHVIMDLTHYEFSMSGKMSISLYMQGQIKIGEGYFGLLWDIKVSPVIFDLNVVIEGDRIMINPLFPNTPQVTLNAESAGAKMSHLFTQEKAESMVLEFISGTIMTDMRESLSTVFLSFLPITETISEGNVTIRVGDLTKQIEGSEFVAITGDIFIE